MAVAIGAARDLPSALDLTPNQVVDFGVAMARLRGGESSTPVRYGTKDQFKAAVLGATGGR